MRTSVPAYINILGPQPYNAESSFLPAIIDVKNIAGSESGPNFSLWSWPPQHGCERWQGKTVLTLNRLQRRDADADETNLSGNASLERVQAFWDWHHGGGRQADWQQAPKCTSSQVRTVQAPSEFGMCTILRMRQLFQKWSFFLQIVSEGWGGVLHYENSRGRNIQSNPVYDEDDRELAESLHSVIDQWIQYNLRKQFTVYTKFMKKGTTSIVKKIILDAHFHNVHVLVWWT